jgi:hypothetical protein
MKKQFFGFLMDVSNWIFDQCNNPDDKIQVVGFAFQHWLYKVVEKFDNPLFLEWIEIYG